jgi:ubiquitin-conjugating enzyme E2 T
MANTALLKRLQRELQLLECEPPPGISAWPKDGNKITEIEACTFALSAESPALNPLTIQPGIIGASDTPYENGVFKLEITVPERYDGQFILIFSLLFKFCSRGLHQKAALKAVPPRGCTC